MQVNGLTPTAGPAATGLLKAEGRRFDPAPDHHIATLALARRPAQKLSVIACVRDLRLTAGARLWPSFAVRWCTRGARSLITSLEGYDCQSGDLLRCRSAQIRSLRG